MPNIENLKIVRDQIARLPPEKLQMPIIIAHRDCGTVACIAGWTSILNGGPQETDEHGDGPWVFAQEFLGLTPDEADALFCAYWTPEDLKATHADVLKELNRIIETGHIRGQGSYPEWEGHYGYITIPNKGVFVIEDCGELDYRLFHKETGKTYLEEVSYESCLDYLRMLSIIE